MLSNLTYRRFLIPKTSRRRYEKNRKFPLWIIRGRWSVIHGPCHCDPFRTQLSIGVIDAIEGTQWHVKTILVVPCAVVCCIFKTIHDFNHFFFIFRTQETLVHDPLLAHTREVRRFASFKKFMWKILDIRSWTVLHSISRGNSEIRTPNSKLQTGF